MSHAAELLDRLTPAGRRILDVAAALFYQRGIHAVGVEAIADGAGVTKKTLYACFGSKDRLVEVYLSERDRLWREWLVSWVEERAETPREKLLAAFDALGEWMAREDFRGCGFVNAFAELPAPDHPAREVIVQHKRWMLDHFATLAVEIGLSDPDDYARSALLLYEGVTVATATGFADAAAQARGVAAKLMA